MQGSEIGPAQCDGFQELYGGGAQNLFACVDPFRMSCISFLAACVSQQYFKNQYVHFSFTSIARLLLKVQINDNIYEDLFSEK